jgi:hypothetical protein
MQIVPRVNYEVRFVEKTFRLTPWESVTHLLGTKADGSTWRMTYYEAVRRAAEGTAQFYIMRGGVAIQLIVVNNAMAHPCLRAKDDAATEILLSLPVPNE